MKYEEKTIPCKYCGNPTRRMGTKMCDGCYEVELGIKFYPATAEKILTALGWKVERPK